MYFRLDMTKFILRVDDIGQDLDQSHEDENLAYFWKWWNAGGWGDEPIYLGVVPLFTTHKTREVLLELEEKTDAVICLHGWDHHPHKLLPEDLTKGQALFPKANCIIPPFNDYDGTVFSTLEKEFKDPVLFGGLPTQHHAFGDAPTMIGSILHLSAQPDLYTHSYRLVDLVQDFPDPGYPVVITLHHRWDCNFLDGVGKLRKALEGLLVSVDAARPV